MVDDGKGRSAPKQEKPLVGTYDRARPLFIDQVLAFSTHLGGKGEDKAHGIAVDTKGNMYVVGETKSFDFPAVAPLQDTLRDDPDESPRNTGEAFVSKFNPYGDLIYSTFLGGSGKDAAYGIAVDGIRIQAPSLSSSACQ